MTATAKIVANTTWQSIETGPKEIILNPEKDVSHIFIGTTTPNGATTNFLSVTPWAERQLTVTIETGDALWVKSAKTTSVLSYIKRTVS